MARTCSFCLVQLVLVSSEPLPLRDIDAFLDPVFVPDFFFDLAEGTEVFDALSSVAPDGQSYRASVLDLMVPEAPRMAPVLLWQTRLWRALSGADISQVIIDVGAHEWSRFLPELRADPRAWLVLVEPGRAAFLELYRRLKVDYADVLSRVVALPVALSWKPGLTWGFRSLHTNDFLGGECNSLLAPNESFDHACTAKGPVIIVPVTSLDLLLHGLMLGTKPSEAKPDFSEALQQGPPIKLKLDAQGADVEILSALAYSSSPLASAFLERIEEVQLEVSVPLYHGQPSRHQTLTRMLELGYQLDWRREEIQDGGTHKVVMGCRLVAENPRTEDCFFVRSSSWPHGRVLDLVMRRPVEILRLNEGSELSISSQYSYYMKRHVDECEQDEEMMMLTKQMGTGLACLFGAVGWPLRFVIHAVIELWELIWSVKRDLDQDAVLSHYVRVFKAMWGILMLDGHSWEELHDAGVAHMVFTVLVEATCLAFPAACSTECQNSDAHEMALLAGRPSPCVTLADCAHLMIDHFDDVVENPGSYVRIFRAAERLSAPRCFQLKMELDRSRSPMFPSTVTSGGEYNVTALDADTTHCALEISLVAWSVDADGMLLFHRHIWEMTDHIKAMDSTDFRMPTEGALWEFECVFEGQRSRGDVFSASMLAEMPGTKDPPVLFVRCEAPERWADDLVSGGSAPDFPHEVVLRRSARAPLQMPNLELVVPLRQSLRQAEPRPHIALCTQQVWDFEGLEQRVPKHAEFWFRYYSDYLGVDKIYLYDLDGSFRELSIVKELQERGKLFYEGSIPSIPPLRDLYQKAGYKTSTTHLAQTLVQQHCWQRARQNADWVISVSHGWDMFLFSPSMGTLADLLQELDPRELTYVLGVRYGIKQDAPKAAEANVFTRFPYHIDPSVRPEQLLSTEEQIVIANPRLVDTAVLGDVVIRQEAPLYSNMLAPLETCSSTPEFAGPLMQKRVLDPLKWRANHYVSLLGRAVVFRVEEATPQLRDFSIYDAAAVELGHYLAR